MTRGKRIALSILICFGVSIIVGIIIRCVDSKIKQQQICQKDCPVKRQSFLTNIG